MSRIIPGCYDMDYVELCWILWIIVVIILIRKYRKKNPLIFLGIIILYFRVPFVYGMLTFSTLLSGNMERHAYNTRFLYNKLLDPKFLGNKLPDTPTIILCNYPSSYVEYLRDTIKDALNDLGNVFEFTYDKIKIQIDLKDFNLSDDELDEYYENCDNNPACVFRELVSEGNIDLPKPSFDDRWYPSIDEDDFNQYLSDRLYDI